MLETIYKTKQKRDYLNKRFSVVDTTQTSPNYFNVFSVPSTLTAGKNIIKVGINGPYLKRGYEIDVEVLDTTGAPLYTEYTGFQDRYGYYYITVYVYDITPPGVGTISLVGIANYDMNGKLLSNPASEHVREYSVIWSKKVDIRSTDRNTTDIIFHKSPEVTVTQVLTPYKFNIGTYAINQQLTPQYISGLEIRSTTNTGYDLIEATSADIESLDDVNNSYNYFLKSSTANIVQTNIRKYNKDVQNGYVYSEYSRFSTILYDDQGRLTKDMEGSVFSFADLDYGASITGSWQYPLELSSSYIQISGGIQTLPDQLRSYKPKIVTVVNNKVALLSKPPTIKVTDSQNVIRPIQRDFQVSKITNLTGSFVYPTSSQTEVQSTNLSSSYIQFTFMDLNPIGGDVYRIKTFAKEAGRNAEYYQLNDHIVTPPEFLIDSDKQNQAVYVKNKSDFFVYGEFTTASIAIDYWRGFSITNNNITQYSFNLTSSQVVTNYPLSNALIISSSTTNKRGTTSKYYQTYVPGQPYSLSFYCTLDPGCELEVYMGSTPLKDTVLGLQAPRAFNESRDLTGNQAYNKFGKLVGKISNMSGSAAKAFDNVVFDFFADADGFGRPVLLLNTNSATNKVAHISSISITPLDLVGYTPSILQFATTTPDSINILQDDDASLTQSLDLKIEYFTVDGKQSEYVTYIPNVQINMINEVPGFCTSEASKFNDHCPFYYEVGTTATTKPNSGTSSLTPTQYTDRYFWPTFSLNNAGGYYWNLRNFSIQGTSYNAVTYTQPISSSITSSWFRYDPLLPLYAQTIPAGGGGIPRMYSASAAGVYSVTPIDNIESNENSSSYDRPFYNATGVAIDRYTLAYSQSILCTYTNSVDIQANSTELNKFQTYLRRSRLYYPATSSTYVYGFHENGGIYNVRFKIAKGPRMIYARGGGGTPYSFSDNGTVINASSQFGTYTKTNDLYKFQPETGSKLMVYIADVATSLSSLAFVPGREGWFPPQNNIVTIGNGYSTTPSITFYDPGSGYNYDQYDIVLVQYGEKGQLVFDASGVEYALDTNGYYKLYNNTNQAFWGGIISDIEWCKIGITTDPRFVKPVNFDNVFNNFIPYTPPPPPPPPQDPYSAESTGGGGTGFTNNTTPSE